MVRGVIFDLDGTLVDSNDLHTEAWQETFRHFGKEFTYVRHSKPAPDVFLTALNELRLPAQEAVVVGDAPFDVQAAKKSQLSAIGLLCGGFPEDELLGSGAVAIYRDVADLLRSYQRSPIA